MHVPAPFRYDGRRPPQRAPRYAHGIPPKGIEHGVISDYYIRESVHSRASDSNPIQSDPILYLVQAIVHLILVPSCIESGLKIRFLFVFNLIFPQNVFTDFFLSLVSSSAALISRSTALLLLLRRAGCTSV